MRLQPEAKGYRRSNITRWISSTNEMTWQRDDRRRLRPFSDGFVRFQGFSGSSNQTGEPAAWSGRHNARGRGHGERRTGKTSPQQIRVNLFQWDAIRRPLSGSGATDGKCPPCLSTCEHSSLIGFARVRFSRIINEQTLARNLVAPREPMETELEKYERQRPMWKWGDERHNE